MSGHNKWSGIKHRKEAQDNKRAAVFTKLGSLITIAAREGGDPDANFKLRLVIDNARAVNMPKENIERAIKRGTGELKEGAALEELTYEAYGPGQVALLIECITDNKNRAVSEVKNILTKGGGKFVPTGSVSFIFSRHGLIAFDTDKYPVETLENETLESGADDFRIEDKVFLVVTKPDNLQTVRTYFEGKNMAPESAELGYLPTQTVTLSDDDLATYEKLRETLDDHGDVQTVWDNLN